MKKDHAVVGGLLLLSVVPMIGGIARLQSLSSPTIENARFTSASVPIILHIVAASLYALLGAFQFSSSLRRRFPRWHRYVGSVLALAGIVAGLTGVWMTLFYRIPREMQGPVLLVVRVLVGAGTVSAIVLAMTSIRRRDIAGHEAWMTRAYALAQGAGTQALVLGPWIAITGSVLGLQRDLLMTLAWLINVAFAEWVIRRRMPVSTPPARVVSLSRA